MPNVVTGGDYDPRPSPAASEPQSPMPAAALLPTDSTSADFGRGISVQVSVDSSASPFFDLPLMHALPECQAPAASSSELLHATCLVLFTVVMWPLSAPLLALAYGPRRAWLLLGNLGLMSQTSWVAEARAAGVVGRQWLAMRWGTMLSHHGSTAALLAGLAVFFVFREPWPLPSDASPAAVTWHILWLQLCSTGISVFIWRISFAALSSTWLFSFHPQTRALMRDLTRAEIPPPFSGIFVGMPPRQFTGQSFNLTVGRELGLSPETPLLTMTQRAYAGFVDHHASVGVNILPGLQTLVDQPGSCVRAPAGEAVLYIKQTRCAPLQRLARLDADDAELARRLALRSEPRVVVTWLLSSPFHASLSAAAVSRLSLVSLCTLLLMLAIAVLPYAVRDLSGIPTSGVTQSDAAVLALLTAAELLCYAMPFCALGVGAGLSFIGTQPVTFLVFAQCHQALRAMLAMIRPRPPGGDAAQVEEEDANEVGGAALRSSGSLGAAAGAAASAACAPAPRVRLVPALPIMLTLSNAGLRPPAATARRPRVSHALESLRGGWPLDNAAAVYALRQRVRYYLRSMSASGVGGAMTVANALAPSAVMLCCLALAIVFTAQPNALDTALYGAAFRRAAIVPTAVNLSTFLVNCGVLIASFAEAAGMVGCVRCMDDVVLDYAADVAEYLAELAALEEAERARAATTVVVVPPSPLQTERRMAWEASNSSSSSASLKKGVGVLPPAPSRGSSSSASRSSAALLSSDERRAAWEHASALRDALRELHSFLAHEAANACGIRFLGCIPPGPGTLGGLFALMGSASILASRLATSVYSASSVVVR